MNEEIDLQQLGLTRVEAKVYIALLKTGSTTTGPLVKAASLHRATVYDVLKRLMEKGLADYIVKEKTKHFEAARPEHLIELLQEKKEEFKKKEEDIMHLVYKLNKMQALSKQKQDVHIFIGIKGIKSILEGTLNCKEHLVLGSLDGFKGSLGSYFSQFQKKKKNIGVKTRFIPQESPTLTIIYGNKAATFIWTEQPIAFLIESKEAADLYRNCFKKEEEK